ncbi:MAG: DUF5666 domain-containing protein [Armatimonadota bacterium]|nr:DUF5666 domain-containing protein [Armatimonadota bacterium]
MRTPIVATTLLALGLAGGLSSALPVRADRNDSYPYQGQASFTLDGTVDKVDVDRDRVIVNGDDGRTYTLDTSRSSIALRGTSRRGETGDLVPGMRLHITGTRLSGDIVEADNVAVQPFRSVRPTIPMPGHRSNAPIRDSDPYSQDSDPSYGDSQGISLRGTVDSVDNRRGSFVLRINDHTRTVYVNDRTDVSDIDRNSDSGNHVPLKAGDRISVAGVLQSDGTVTADTLSARNLTDSGNNYRNDNSYRRGNQLQGVVTQTGNKLLSRDIKVRLSSGREVTVHVPKNISVRRNGRTISVHDLTSEDQVRIDGRYDGNDFKATRIEVTGRGYNTYRDGGNDSGSYNRDGDNQNDNNRDNGF